jgi:hypothetical protein
VLTGSIGIRWYSFSGRTARKDQRAVVLDALAPGGVAAYLQRAAVEQSDDHRRQALELELARLDQLQSAYYPAAMAGDILAATFVLNVIARRCTIMGFDKPDDRVAQSRTVVITWSSEEYIAGLKSIVNQSSIGDSQ